MSTVKEYTAIQEGMNRNIIQIEGEKIRNEGKYEKNEKRKKII